MVETVESIVKRYYNGIMESKGDKLNGKREGKWFYYFYTGELKEVRHYTHDKINGMVFEYNKNGSIYSKSLWFMNELVYSVDYFILETNYSLKMDYIVIHSEDL